MSSNTTYSADQSVFVPATNRHVSNIPSFITDLDLFIFEYMLREGISPELYPILPLAKATYAFQTNWKTHKSCVIQVIVIRA
jgi:hypothetical protein